MLNTQFFKKFAKPELKSIAGKRYSNLLVLSTILILSMMAIGLGEGAISYLDKKMNNPFVSFVNVKIPMGNRFQDPDLMQNIYDKAKKEVDSFENNGIENLTKKDSIEYEKNLTVLGGKNLLKDSVNFFDFYGFKKPYAVFESYESFINRDLNIKKLAKVRKGDEYDPVYDYIDSLQQADDKFYLKNNFDYDGWGCVVSLDFLQSKNKLNYDENNIPFINYRKPINGSDAYFSIPVQGIVESFPDGVDILAGEKLFNAFHPSNYNFWASLTDIDSNRTSYLQYYVFNNDSLKNYLVENDFKEIEYDDIIHEGGKMFKKNNLTFDERSNILNNSPNLKTSNIKQVGFMNVLDFNHVHSPRDISLDKEYFVFEFQNDRLDGISYFNSFLKNNTAEKGKSLEIDMRIIESKKNFDLFKKLASLLSYALIFFSIFSIVLYITNLIVTHISKNKKNLGTLKAFGLSNNNIILIYSAISIALITISFIISFFISALIGNMLVSAIANYFEIGDASTLNYISYPVHVLAAFFIMLPSLAIYLKLRIELKDNTPGDLIYGRE